MNFNKLFLLLLFITSVSCGNLSRVKNEKNTIKSQSKEIALFDGKSFNGWRGHNRSDIPAAWSIDGDAIKINKLIENSKSKRDGGDIIFGKKFNNFTLSFEWKVSEGANSGVFYLADEIKGERIWKSGLEYQILDNERHPDAKLGKNNNRQSASLYDLIPANPQNAKPAGKWNAGKITVMHGMVTHSQNGVVVLRYMLWTNEWKKMIDDSKFKDIQSFINVGGDNKEGYIGLQDHRDDVWFRNIRLRYFVKSNN